MSDYEFKPITYFEPGDRIYAQAQQAWVILTGVVTAHQMGYSNLGQPLVTYGDLAEAMGKGRQAGRTLTRQLWMIGEYCKFNGLPTLNSIVVNQETGLPGHDVVLNSGNDAQTEMRNVGRYRWSMLRPPSIATFRDVWEQINE